MEVKSKFSLPFLHSLKLRKEELINEVNSKNGGNFRLNYKKKKGKLICQHFWKRQKLI